MDTLPQLIWPLCFLLVSLLILRQVRDDLRPIVRNVIEGLSKQAGTNAVAFAIAFGFGISASISAFIDVFHQLTRTVYEDLSVHQYAVMWAKVLNPFVVAVLAYATQSKFQNGNGGSRSGTTNPPFQSPAP